MSSTRPWLSFLAQRLGTIALAFVLLILITFFVVPLIPGDPAVLAAGPGATSAQIESARIAFGLDKPIVSQFSDYVRGLLSLDWGRSFSTRADVFSLIVNRLPYTATIALLAIILTLTLGVSVGTAVAVATRGGRHPWVDHGFNAITGSLFAIPQYVMGTFLVLLIAINFGWLPAGGAEGYSSVVLPTIALAIGPTCTIARIVRREAALVFQADYIRTARGWRLPPLQLNLRYVLPNIMTNVLTVSGLILAGMLGSAVVVETIFAWPGVGTALINSVLANDYPVARAIIFVLGLLSVLLIVFVDIILAIVDPRTLTSGADHA